MAKTKTPAPRCVPQSDAEAREMIARLGILQRELERRETDMNAALANIKQKVEAAAAPLRERHAEATEALRIYCAAHRDRLTQGGRSKTVDFGTGTVAWRQRPPKVTLSGKVEAVLEALLAGPRAWRKFIRVKNEIDKEAMLAAPETALTVPGVKKIGSAGEDFVVEPFEAQLAEAS